MTMAFTRISAAAVAMLCAVHAPPTAFAGESGSFDLIEVHLHDYATLERLGRTVTGGPLDGTATILKSSGVPFTESTNFRARCLVYVKRSDTGIDLEAPCTLTDRSGDELYLLARRSRGDVEAGGGGRGSQRIVGGTGKYAGIAGNCPYTTSYLPDKWLVSRATCTWQKP